MVKTDTDICANPSWRITAMSSTENPLFSERVIFYITNEGGNASQSSLRGYDWLFLLKLYISILMKRIVA